MEQSELRSRVEEWLQTLRESGFILTYWILLSGMIPLTISLFVLVDYVKTAAEVTFADLLVFLFPPVLWWCGAWWFHHRMRRKIRRLMRRLVR